MLFQPELRGSKLTCATPRKLGNKAFSFYTTAAHPEQFVQPAAAPGTPFSWDHTKQTAHQIKLFWQCLQPAHHLSLPRSHHLTILLARQVQVPIDTVGKGCRHPSPGAWGTVLWAHLTTCWRKRTGLLHIFQIPQYMATQEGYAGIWTVWPDTTIPASSLHKRHKTIFSPPELLRQLNSTLSAQVQKHACVGAVLLGKGRSLPRSTRISAQHEYVVGKERKTTRIRTELEWGTSSTSGKRNTSFSKNSKSQSSYLYFRPLLMLHSSCCKRQPSFLGTWFPPSSASLGLLRNSTISTLSFSTGQLERATGRPFEAPVFPQQYIAIPDHWLQRGSAGITLTSTSSVQFAFPTAELKTAEVKFVLC